MSRLTKLIALLLVAVWLPVTLHCELEITGLLGPAGECVASDDACCNDTACVTVEEALFKDSTPVLTVSAPDASTCLVCLALATPPDAFFAESALSTVRHEPPPELRVTWQFLSRAALLARAPDALNA